MAHMVADAIGAPAERQFAEITRADDKTLLFASQPEEKIRAQAGLDVLEIDIVNALTA